MTHVFDVPRDLAFQTITTPELPRKRFFGRPGWSLPVCEIDLRAGGGFRYLRRGPDGAEMGVRGCFLEVAAPETIVHTEVFDAAWYPGEAVVAAALAEAGGQTTLTLLVTYQSREARDTVLRTPMEHGVAPGYDRLAELLAEHG